MSGTARGRLRESKEVYYLLSSIIKEVKVLVDVDGDVDVET